MKSALLILSIAALTLAGPLAASAETPRYRPATKNQILKHLSGSSQLKTARNGFQYKPGNPNGYKVSHGKICVLAPRRTVDCVSVKTNGAEFQMIDRRGGRSAF